MEKTEYNLKEEVIKYGKKYDFDIEVLSDAVQVVEDLLSMFIEDTKVNSPQAINNLDRLRNAKSEVTNIYHELQDML